MGQNNEKKSCRTNPPTPPYDPKNAVLPLAGGRENENEPTAPLSVKGPAGFDGQVRARGFA